MSDDLKLSKITARVVFDGGGNLVPEFEITWSDGTVGWSCFAGGITVGPIEKRKPGGDVIPPDGLGAMTEFSSWATDCIQNLEFNDQSAFDGLLERHNFSNWVGQSGCVALSCAFAKGAAKRRGLPLYKVLGKARPWRFPFPNVTIIGGGAHAGGVFPIQEIMVVPIGAETFIEALNWCKEVFVATKMRLVREGYFVGTTIEGGIWPPYRSVEQSFELVCEAISDVGLNAGTDVVLSLDVAANELRDANKYYLGDFVGHLQSDSYFELLSRWISNYPIGFLEDPFAPQDGDLTRRLLARCVDSMRIIADDPVASEPDRIIEVGAHGEFNGILVKPTHCGSLTAVQRAVQTAFDSNLMPALGGRSRETEEHCMIHIALAYGFPLLKIGGFSGVDRISHWNEGLRLVESLGHAELVNVTALIGSGSKLDSHKVVVNAE
ncbi:hypothetical protein [Roseibium album]|uniref:hypothetical protein n=1 Tax=Roseibium album TaxID=311410 RepID=UPI00391B5607